MIGAGPGGLTAAYALAAREQPGVVFEATGQVGGLARTVEYDGYRFDLGGHRFFTKLAPIERLWEEMLGAELLTRPRLSRIFYQGEFFSYPLRIDDVVRRLGLRESALCGLSYLRSAVRPGPPPATFEDWVTSRFGVRLYDTFFRSYTEKVWDIPGTEIDAAWAAQRIKNFSLAKALLRILGLRPRGVTTLIEEFRYPRLGPGQMWEAFADAVAERGVPVRLRAPCRAIVHRDGRVQRVVVGPDGEEHEYAVSGVLSSMALSDLVESLQPSPPADVVAAARRLRYRDLCLVALVTTQADPFPDNWIYLHDPGVRAGRVQNFGAWSADMVRPGTTCLGVEYFCFAGDEIWEMADADAIDLATAELARIGLVDPAQVVDGAKVRVPKAYPMYSSGYKPAVARIRAYLAGFANLQTFGRNGLHRYNNQDHSMWTALLATANLLDGARHDVWSVNTDWAYLEEVQLSESLADLGAIAASRAVAASTA